MQEEKIEMDGVYVLEGRDLKKLFYVLKELYGDGTHITPDHRRDIAHIMSFVLEERIFPEK